MFKSIFSALFTYWVALFGNSQWLIFQKNLSESMGGNNTIPESQTHLMREYEKLECITTIRTTKHITYLPTLERCSDKLKAIERSLVARNRRENFVVNEMCLKSSNYQDYIE